MISSKKTKLFKIDLSENSDKSDKHTLELILSHRKTISIEISDPKQIKVRAPFSCPQEIIMDFVNSKKGWILKHLKLNKKKQKLPSLSAEECEILKNETLTRAQLFLRTYNGRMPNKITIRKQKTIWGSCSSQGNISLNLNCGLLSDDLFEYVLLHELAHLYEMNHSAAFWSKLAERLPDYKKRRAELRNISLNSNNNSS